jgi:hypothetical protein
MPNNAQCRGHVRLTVLLLLASASAPEIQTRYSCAWTMACDIADIAVGTLPQAYGSCSATANGGKHV